MPEEKLCPVVDSYIRHARAYWSGVEGSIRDVYQIQLETFDELRDNPGALIRDPATQKLRAFFCLHGLAVLLNTRLLGNKPQQKFPLTREGIQSLIQFCNSARDASEVKLYASQLSSTQQGTVKLLSIEKDTVVALTNIIIEAAEYFRPRLATEGPLAGMGRFYARGLMSVRAPSDRFIQYGRELINVSKMSIAER
jgi:hypothetical protein